MRGLTVFITDIRNCSNKEDEEKRVNKEMAKIRKVFKEKKDITGYDRRKYVSKILYMFMLGYEVNFGYMEAVALLSSLKFQEKLVGYLALAILLHENHEMLPLIVQSLQNDLQSRNEYHQAMALTAIGNIGGKEMAESLAPIVQKLLISKSTKATIKKKAALCLLKLFRRYPDLITADVWLDRLFNLLDEHDLGILTSVMGLLLGLANDNPKGYEPAVKKAIWLLTKIIINKDYTKDYVYYNMANPWLQVKILRFLSLYPPPTDATAKTRLYEILKKVLSSADVAKGQTVNHKNALHSVLFEAIQLVIHYDDDRDLIRQAANLLGRFISPKEHSNIRYLGLATLGQLAGLDSDTANLVKKHHDTVLLALRDPDISIRKRALDLLYTMCDRHNSNSIVTELLDYLHTADFLIRDELVLKIAILAEKFAQDYSWYVDVILQLIALAGEAVSDEIWFRVVQIVTNHQDIQQYAANTVLKAVRMPNCHETAVKVGGYILGEFGHLIADNPDSGPMAQFNALHQKFGAVSQPTRALLLSTYVKLVNLYPEMTDTVRQVFQQHVSSLDAEIQQRAHEYLNLTQGSEDLLQAVWDVMPAFPERDINRIGQDLLGPQGNTPQTTPKSQRPPSSPQAPPSQPTAATSQPKAYDPMRELEDIFSSPIPPQHSSSVVSQPVMQQPIDLLGGPVNTGSGISSDLSSLVGFDGGYGQRINASASQPNANTNMGAQPYQIQQGGSGSLTGLESLSQPNQGLSLGAAPSGSGDFGMRVNSTGNATKIPTKVVFADSGVLYQDSNIQIGFKWEVNSGKGRVMLYYGNMTPNPLTGFNAACSSQGANMTVVGQAVPNQIEGKTQATQVIVIECVNDFEGIPTLQVQFTAMGSVTQLNLELPVTACKFMEPNKVQGGDFFKEWKMYENPPQAETVIVKSNSPVDVGNLNKLLANGFHFAVLQGVDPNQNNVVACSNLRTQAGMVLILLRIETNPQHNMYRATVKSKSAKITQALKDLLNQQLAQ
eukprot:TRINITY_DN3251_c0_g5_i1.p1 TRINITY_DN3251_c0_g5~~TRINITY_DN3251_c0_g5_i1.p1  ORF type:complete len:1030 (+),score=309.97 TRINITY_DN3251_c0_g5_i1:73-3090(+)